MKAKIPKCASLGLQASTGKKVDPMFTLEGYPIQYAPEGVRFWGLKIEIPPDHAKSRVAVVSELEHMLCKVDRCHLTRKQKLLLYRAGVCPRLSWLLTIVEFPITWVEKNLNTMATSYLKRWSGLARPANTAPLYLPQKLGGLNPPLMSYLHKRLQVSRQAQLLTSQDSCVRHIAEKALQRDLSLSLSRKKFKASVREVMKVDPGCTTKSLTNAAKHLCQEEDDHHNLSGLQQLEKQGHMSCCSTSEGAEVWGRALSGVADEHLKFALNSGVDTLPHNANLCLWRKCSSDSCPLCGERQTLVYVLHSCKQALKTRRYNRHDAVLTEIRAVLETYTSPPASLSTDLGSYLFPQHIVSTDLRPDVVWWDDTRNKICLVELTICFESSFHNAAERKKIRYEKVVERARASGYTATFILLEVGLRRIINPHGFDCLKKVFNITKCDYTTLLVQLSRIAITESFKIWCMRNADYQNDCT